MEYAVFQMEFCISWNVILHEAVLLFAICEIALCDLTSSKYSFAKFSDSLENGYNFAMLSHSLENIENDLMQNRKLHIAKVKSA